MICDEDISHYIMLYILGGCVRFTQKGSWK